MLTALRTIWKRNSVKHIIYICVRIVCSVLFVISAVLFCISNWVSECLDVTFGQILSTFSEPLEGADILSSLKSQEAIKQILIFLMLVFALIISGIVENKVKRKVNAGEAKQRSLTFFRLMALGLSALLSAGFLSLTWINLRVGEYFSASKQVSTIYEDY